MYNNKSNCGCGNTVNPLAGNVGCPAPVVAPKKVCVSQSNRYVEQPVICPIECRHIQNLVYYPRYYPRYEQTYVTRDQNGNIISASGTGMPYGNAAMNTAGMAGSAMDANAYGNNFGNSFKNGCGA